MYRRTQWRYMDNLLMLYRRQDLRIYSLNNLRLILHSVLYKSKSKDLNLRLWEQSLWCCRG